MIKEHHFWDALNSCGVGGQMQNNIIKATNESDPPLLIDLATAEQI